MKSESAAYGPIWAGLLDELAALAPTPGGRTLCLNLRPAWEASQVQYQQNLTREMSQLLELSCWQNQPAKADWLKPLLTQTGASGRELQNFLSGLQQLREILESRSQTLPTLWKMGRDLQPEPALLKLLSAGRISAEAHKLLLQRQGKIKAQIDLFDRFSLIYAKARLGQSRQGELAKIGNSIKLKNWTPERLSQGNPLELSLSSDLHALILSGQHGSGKTRLLQSLYLACLMHQSGIPQRCAPDSTLPVFSGLWLIDAELALTERLERLKPLLRSPAAGRLLLIDDFPAHSAPGEAYALGKVLIEKLCVKGSLTVAATHHPLLTKLGSNKPKSPLRTLAILREGSRQNAKLTLSWDQIQPAGLIERARAAGWPADLLRQAEATQKSLSQPKSPAPKPAVKKSPTPSKEAPKVPLKPIRADVPAGSWVYLPDLNIYGELMNTPGKRQRVQVLSQGMTLEVPADRVVLSSHRKEKKGDISGIKIQTWSVTGDACDLHGLTVDEALPLLDKFLDTAYYQGLPQVRIIHGKGTSALRRAVQIHLSETAYVRRYRLGHPGEGDSGVTVVELGEKD